MPCLPGEQAPLNLPRIDSDLAYASERDLSLHADSRPTPSFCSSLREGASLAAVIPHAATQHHSPDGRFISANVHAPASQPQTPLFIVDPDPVFYPFCANAVAHTNFREPDDGKHAECNHTLDIMHASDIRIGVNSELHMAHALPCAQDNPLQSHHGPAEKFMGQFSQYILRGADLLLSRIPNILDERVLYGRNCKDMILFNRARINESVITCQMGMCGTRVEVKNLKIHLKLKHSIKSNSRSYKCLWPECFSRTTQLSSLVRHITSCHGSLYWDCCCGRSFTRVEGLLKHFNKCPAATTG